MGNKFLLAAFVVLFVTGCGGGGGGDIEISPTTVDNSVNDSNNTNTGGGGDSNADDICAAYTNASGQLIQGSADADGNCNYSSAFTDAGNVIEQDMTIPALPNGRAHIFEGSLFVGRNYDTDEGLANAGITEGGDGPVLTIEAGATLAFQSSSDFVIINRGSQIFAVGTADAPITFTSVSDVNGTVSSPEAVQQWGGMVINGFGVTNKCQYTGTRGTAGFSTTECHVAAEGAAGLDTSHYGGDNDEDSSGRLEYVVTKYTGAEVAAGDELNGISFGGVGSNTIVRNLQVYSTYDDGIEMFGGSVNFENFVAVYARDDSIDIDEGYNGTITNALVIQSETDGNHCIEADGIGSFSGFSDAEIEGFISQNLQSAPTITNLTCIVSPNGADTATHDPGAGWRFREGIMPVVSDSMVISAPGTDSADNNYCLRIDNRSATAAADGDLVLTSNLFACQDQSRGDIGAQTVAAWAGANGNQFATLAAATDPTATADTDLVLLEGTPPVYSVEFGSMVIDGADPAVAAPASGLIGSEVLSASESWLRPGGVDWTYGIFDGARGQALWFE